MRKFKFRAWNTLVGRYRYFDFKTLSEQDPEKIKWGHLIFEQYTGLRDKNGKEIYEGDIVHCVGWQGQKFTTSIMYDKGRAKFCLSYFDELEPFTNPDNKWTLEVLGNIHENYELIGGEDE